MEKNGELLKEFENYEQALLGRINLVNEEDDRYLSNISPAMGAPL